MKEFNLTWFGMLTTQNIEKVADLLLQLLEGKRYTFVKSNQSLDFKPDVKTGHRLYRFKNPADKAVRVQHYYHPKGSSAQLIIFDTAGVSDCSTNLLKDEDDPEFNNPHFCFERDKVTITHRASSGSLLYWVIAIEKDD